MIFALCLFTVGQRGFGPDSKFSFGISINYYEDIKDGFYLEYNGSVLYEYSLINYLNGLDVYFKRLNLNIFINHDHRLSRWS